MKNLLFFLFTNNIAIYTFIKTNQEIVFKKIARIFGISLKTVQYYLKKLKQAVEFYKKSTKLSFKYSIV